MKTIKCCSEESVVDKGENGSYHRFLLFSQRVLLCHGPFNSFQNNPEFY